MKAARYLVVGTSGAGKTTLAKALAQAKGYVHIELDAHYWATDWQPMPTEQFTEAVIRMTSHPFWIADGDYVTVQDLVWRRATHIVWLNYAPTVVFSRLLKRTLRRCLSGEALWNGNQESLRMAFASKNSILLAALTTFASNRRKYTQLRSDPALAHLVWTELRRPSDASALNIDCANGHGDSGE